MKYRIISVLAIIAITLIIGINITFAKTGTIQNSDYLNLRESATASSKLLTKMPGDAEFEILLEESGWYKVKYNEYVGYVNKEYVKIKEEKINKDVPAKANSKGIINKDVDIYVLPLLNSTKIGNLKVGNEVLVVSIAGKWAYVQTDNISGWIYKENVNGLENTNLEDNNSDDNEQANNETTNNEVANNNTVNNDENITNTQDKNETSPEEVINDGNLKEDIDFPATMYVNVEAVYVRESTSTESEIVTSVGLNTPVTVNGEKGEWYKVNLSDGSGYMMKKYLSNPTFVQASTKFATVPF